MRKTTSAVALTAALLALGGCAQAVPMHPAEDATNPACAEVMVRLPEAVAGLERRETNAQATAAWGNPAVVLLTCGVAVPEPTATIPCAPPVEGVDWLRDAANDPDVLFITYGRDPAIEVFIGGEPTTEGARVSPLAVLTDLAIAVNEIPATRECISLEDLEPVEE